MSIEAMKQALDMVKSWQKTCLDLGRDSNELGRATETVDLLRQAITDMEQQEPAAYMGTDSEGNPNKFRLSYFSGAIPLYTVPLKEKNHVC